MAVSMTAMMLSVDLFVVGGSVAKAGDLFIEPARRVIADHTYSSVGCGIQILPSELDTDAPILGSAWLARQAKSREKPVNVDIPTFKLSLPERDALEKCRRGCV